MTFDELKKPWQETNKKTINPKGLEMSIIQICRKTEKIQGVVFRRDLIEMLACGFCIFFFGSHALSTSSTLTFIGNLIVLGGIVLIMFQLNRRRMTEKPLPLDSPIKDYLLQQKENNEFQIGLLSSVVWWYIAPIIIGVNCVFAGSNDDPLQILLYAIFSSSIGIGIYLLNQRAVRKEFLPIRDELNLLLADFEDSDDDTGV